MLDGKFTVEGGGGHWPPVLPPGSATGLGRVSVYSAINVVGVYIRKQREAPATIGFLHSRVFEE